MPSSSAAPAAEPAGAALDGDHDSGRPEGRLPAHGVTLFVVAIGLVVSAALAFAAGRAYDNNEDRLLRQRTRQAAAVLTAAVPGIQTPLASAVEVAEQGGGDQAPFRRLMGSIVENGQPFVNASLWRVDAEQLAPVVVVGEPPMLASRPDDEIRAFLRRAAMASGLVVLGLLDDDAPRLGYAYTSVSGTVTYVAYAEAPLPPRRTAVVPRDSAFAGLDNAVYLGDEEIDEALLTASSADLPLSGRRHAEIVPFGDTSLLLVMTPTTELGGGLLAALPWLVGLVGLTSTAAVALLVEQLLRRRDRADALAVQNQRLYASQRSVAQTLQQSLLPQELPDLVGMEVAARYVPGVAGLDIGGDWYDVIRVDDRRVLAVVGDVSGRGLEAGTVMASLRYAIRAFASRSEPPDVILTGVARLLDLVRDGHFATVTCALVDIGERTVTIAAAGHPAPVVVDRTGASFLPTEVGPPIGVTAVGCYRSVTHRVAPGATVIMFTDGLFERRGESVDDGLERLRQAAAVAWDRPGESLDRLLTSQLLPDAQDDTAVLALCWTGSTTMT